jgi:hypothetical protein
LVASVCSNGVVVPVLSSSVAGGVPAMLIVGLIVSAPTPYSDVCCDQVWVIVSSVSCASTSGRMVSSA